MISEFLYPSVVYPEIKKRIGEVQMDEEKVKAWPEEVSDGAYPIYFGVSCAFVALHLMSRARRLDVEHGRWSRIGEMMLQGSAHLLGLLVVRAQRRVKELDEGLNKAESEVRELKRRRGEDAKANEKVVGIFAAHEQSWIAEKKKFKLQIQALLSELRVIKAKNKEAILDLNKRVEEGEIALQIKVGTLEEEAKKRRELEEKLRISEGVVEELRERAKKEAQDHSSELWKHKTAFVELVSNQRQLEAELGRAIRQAEAAKQELNEVFERKEEAVSMIDRLSGDIIKLQKDTEQKEKILSAMLRKSKFDTAEKQMLLKEVKITKAKKKQAELDSERWRNMWESRHKRNWRLSKSLEAGSSEERRSELQSSDYQPKTLLLEYLEAESKKEQASPSTKGDNIITTVHCLDHFSSERTDELVRDNIQHLKDWVRLETEKYATILEQRHYAETDAFTEQMRLKDEKIEAFHWQLLSMDLESKRFQSHIEGLDGNLSHLRDENLKLEALLLDREKELKALKEQLSFHVQQCQKSNSKSTCDSYPLALWSEVKVTRKKLREKEQETKAIIVKSHNKVEKKIQEGDDRNTSEDTKLMQLDLLHKRESMYKERKDTDIITTSSDESSPPTNNLKDYPIIYVNELSYEELERSENSSEDQVESTPLITLIPKDEIEEEKEVGMDTVHVRRQNSFDEKVETAYKSSSVEKAFTTKDSSWKMDIHALGVSYKIKRLKQQLLVLEKVAGPQAMKQLVINDDPIEDSKGNKSSQQMKGLPLVMSLLNKQVKRYQSLEEKTDELCKRMHECYRTGIRDSKNDTTKEKTEMLESFLEETFQLQRYLVATGQKLMEVQSKISCSYAGSEGFDESVGFNLKQFADVVRNLFREIQRGLEVRISRIIGALEGTLACDGILHR